MIIIRIYSIICSSTFLMKAFVISIKGPILQNHTHRTKFTNVGLNSIDGLHLVCVVLQQAQNERDSLCTENRGPIIHWASKETYHFFIATPTKIHHIKINHIWTLISYSTPYETHLKYQRVAFVKKDKNVVKLQKVICQKSQKLLTENLHDRPPIQNIQ